MNVDTDSLERLNLLTRDAAERAGAALSDAIETETAVGATKIRLVNREDIVTDLLGETGECFQVDLSGPLSGSVLLAIDDGALEAISGALADGNGPVAATAAVRELVGAMMDGFVADWETHLGDDLAVADPVHVADPGTHAFDFETAGSESESAPVFQSELRWLEAPATVRLFLVPDRKSLERLLAIDDGPDSETDGSTSGDAAAADESASNDAPATGATIDGVTDPPESDGPDDGMADAEVATPAGSEDDGFDGESPFGTDDDDSPFGTGDGGDADGVTDDADQTGPFDGEDDSGSFSGEDDGGSFDGENGGGSFDSEGADGSFGMGGGDVSFADDEETRSLPLEKLSVFSDLTREGTTAAAERVTQMTGIETETEIAGVSFTPIDDISGQLAGGDYVGTTVEFAGTPSGYLIILFREDSAANIAEAMMPMEPEGEGLTDMHESALEELCNIMSSGFIDGWANVLQTSVEHTPPEFVDDMDLAMVEIITDQLGPFQTHAYTIESHMRTGAIDFDCEIHALPSESGLGEALDELLVERKDQTEADPSDVF